MPSDDALAGRVQAVLDIPLHRFLGIDLRRRDDPSSGIWFPVDSPALNPAEMLHGGVIYTVLDVAAFLALLPHLADGEHAVTHDLTASLLRPVPAGARVDVTASVLRRGRAVAFLRTEAWVDGQLVAAGQVTKTVVPVS
ncbi:PaaI family thioesterase [Blastococcus sp. SYSU DS0617]